MSASGDGWLVVGSTSAGSSGRELIEAVAGRLAADAPAEVAVTDSPEELDEVLGRSEGRVLVAVGGDGSAHVLANAMVRTGRLDALTVAFVPLGTANDFATHLGMVDDPRSAADQLLGGRRRRVDLLSLETGDGEPELVVNALHAGLGVVGARRATPLKPVLGPLAYPVGVTLSGLADRGRRLSVVVDGGAVGPAGPVLAVAVANAPRLGGMALLPEAREDDGLLDVLVVPARPWRSRVGAIGRVLGRDPDAIEIHRGRTVELRGDVGHLDADGEELDVGAECRLSVRPGAMTVLAPG